MTTPLTKLIADENLNVPFDRLAKVTEVLLEGINKVLNRAMVHDHEGYEEIAKATIQRATTIAEGKDNAM